MSAYNLHLGDCIEVMRTLPDNSVDAIVTDPPYELGFMGKGWDASGIANSVTMWAEALRVLKPGGHLLAFSGSRTYHRMAVAIEDAGFEIRDQIQWVFGSGFPKSRSIVKDLEKIALEEMPDWIEDWDDREKWLAQWQGWGTALKPAHEPICMARKPLAKGCTVAANTQLHGTGALNIDGCRVGMAEGEANPSIARYASAPQHGNNGWDHVNRGANFDAAAAASAALGRWPANFIHDGSPEVVALFPAQAGAAAPVHKRSADKFRNSYGAFKGNVDEAGSTYHADSGSAARFFYCAKATRADRNEGCKGMDKRDLNWSSGTQSPGSFQSPNTDRSSENHHPTVKPTALMAYLVKLVTPPGGTVLDPFMGSGSTGKACMQEGFDFIGIDMTPEYVAIAEARIGHAQRARAAAASAPPPQIDLFEDQHGRDQA
jgi:site-specific DNA-methyltransferase (adenine-specific)